MFDATPEKRTFNLTVTQNNRNEAVTRVVQERMRENFGHARLALEALRELHLAELESKTEASCVSDKRAIELIAIWDEEEQVLRDAIRIITGLAPFRLIKTTAAYYDLDGKRRVLCRFAYTGPADDMDRLEQALIAALHQIAPWENARRSS